MRNHNFKTRSEVVTIFEKELQKCFVKMIRSGEKLSPRAMIISSVIIIFQKSSLSCFKKGCIWHLSLCFYTQRLRGECLWSSGKNSKKNLKSNLVKCLIKKLYLSWKSTLDLYKVLYKYYKNYFLATQEMTEAVSWGALQKNCSPNIPVNLVEKKPSHKRIISRSSHPELF